MDLGKVVKVDKVVLQGGDDQEDCMVTDFLLLFSNSSIYWTSRLDSSGDYFVYQTLSNNRYGVHVTRLQEPVLARFLRLVPQNWDNSICLRLDVLGCNVTTASTGIYICYNAGLLIQQVS